MPSLIYTSEYRALRLIEAGMQDLRLIETGIQV
jgi:hypothetical protein